MEVRVDGATLHVETVGAGAPCLCLHGRPGSDASGLVAVLGPLADRVRVLGISWGGFLGLMYGARWLAA